MKIFQYFFCTKTSKDCVIIFAHSKRFAKKILKEELGFNAINEKLLEEIPMKHKTYNFLNKKEHS